MSLLEDRSSLSQNRFLSEGRALITPGSEFIPSSVKTPKIPTSSANEDTTDITPCISRPTGQMIFMLKTTGSVPQNDHRSRSPSPAEIGDESCSSQDTSAQTSQGSSISTAPPASAATAQSSIPSTAFPSQTNQATAKAGGSTIHLQTSSHSHSGPNPEFEIPEFKGLFALPSMGMSDFDKACCFKMQTRLSNAISKLFKPDKGVDNFYSLESMMVKSQGHMPKPALLLTCCNKANKKRLQKIVRLLLKLEAAQTDLKQYPVIVHLGEAAHQISDECDIVGGSTIYTYVPDHTPTFSGVVAEVGGRSGATGARTTIGGTVLVDGKPFLLTVAHPFQSQSCSDLEHDNLQDRDEHISNENQGSDKLGQPSHDEPENEEETSDKDDWGEGDSERDSIYAVFSSDVDRSQSPSETATEITDPKEGFEWSYSTSEPEQSSKICFASLPILSCHRPSTDCLNTKSNTSYDWALIPMGREHVPLMQNLVSVPGARFPTEVTGHMKLEEQRSRLLEVWINAGISGLQKGWIVVDGTALLDFVDTSVMTTRIVLRKPLGKPLGDPHGTPLNLALTFSVAGDSGSWVISHGQVWGHIVAAKASLPWAYMIPFNHIIKDIKSVMNTEDVRLPSTAISIVPLHVFSQDAHIRDDQVVDREGHRTVAPMQHDDSALMLNAPIDDVEILG